MYYQSKVQIIDKAHKRHVVIDNELDVFISAAMINPQGNERENEWISIINLSNQIINLSGWHLSDGSNRSLALETVLDNTQFLPGAAVVIQPIAPMRLINSNGNISLFNDKMERVDYVSYTEKQAAVEGSVISFLVKFGEKIR
ncbi:MAG: lamin tail domain-containing protein [Gammaproteobacteria bacterium]|nr:lamin tail domain-containing protein [Gammaproteobacteria bacterium]